MQLPRPSLSTPSLSRPTLFSLRAFMLVLVLTVAGVLLGALVPVIGGITRYVGLFVAAFAVGLALSGRHYLESALAGGLAGGLVFVLGTLSVGFLPVGVGILEQYGVAIAGVGVGTGVVVTVAGYYFGRDLRSGLTRDLG